MNKPTSCQTCPINHLTGTQFIKPNLPPANGKNALLIVGEGGDESSAASGIAFHDNVGGWTRGILKQKGMNSPQIGYLNVIGCQLPKDKNNFLFPGGNDWHLTPRPLAREAVQSCYERHFKSIVEDPRWHKIIAMGEGPLQLLTGRQGLDQWRGSPLPLIGGKHSKVIPTWNPSILNKGSNQLGVISQDFGKGLTLPPEKYNLYPTIEDVRRWKATNFAFDFEWDSFGNITLCGLSCSLYSAMVVPWQPGYIEELKRIFESATVLIGHNIIHADLEYIRRLNWDISRAYLRDTMLEQHLIQPDYKHGLAFCASFFTNRVFWKGKSSSSNDDDGLNDQQYKTWNHPNGLPIHQGGYAGCRSEEEAFRLYNARDVAANWEISLPLNRLLDQYQLKSIYNNMRVPMGILCKEMGDLGIKVDHRRLKNVRQDIEGQIQELDSTLPEGLKSYEEPIFLQQPAPPDTYKAKEKTCSGKGKDKHPPQTHRFTQPNENWTCPTCSRVLEAGKLTPIKIIKVPSTRRIYPWNSAQQTIQYASSIGLKMRYNEAGNFTADESTRKVWQRKAPEFSVVSQLKELQTQYQTFAKDSLLRTDRMFFDLLVHGTGEVRLASRGRRRGIDLQIQNIPDVMKQLFVPDPGECFIGYDVSSMENYLTAWFSKDTARLHKLNDPNYDEHSDTGTIIFGKPITKKDKVLRNVAKIINHLTNYGGGAMKIQEELALLGMHYELKEVRVMLETLMEGRPELTNWQNQTISVGLQQGYLRNPFGSIRWFQSRSPRNQMLAYLPASTGAECVQRMMIALHRNKQVFGINFNQIIDNLGLSRSVQLPPGWKMVTQIHDEIVLSGPKESWQEAARMVEWVMTQPFRELDEFCFRVEGKVKMENFRDGELITKEMLS